MLRHCVQKVYNMATLAKRDDEHVDSAGGELFDLIVERGHLSERDAAVNARAILEVIRHCHSE